MIKKHYIFIIFPFILLIIGCSESRDVPEANGFFSRIRSVPWGEHPYEISLYRKLEQREVLVCRSLSISCGSPVPLPDGGLLYCAKDLENDNHLFVATKDGRSAKITPNFLRQFGVISILEFKESANDITFEGPTLNMNLTNVVCSADEIAKYAEIVFRGAKKSKLNGVEYYFQP